MRARLLVAGALAAPMLLAVAAPSFASCAAESGPAGSPVIFVGTAEEERRGFTRIAVEEVWTGPDLAPEVWVRSGQEQAPWPLSLFQSVASSVDAELVAGDRYVIGASDDFSTSACSIEELGDAPASAASDRPDDPRPPVDDGLEGAEPPIGPLGQTLWALGVVALLAALRALVWRRRWVRMRAERPTEGT